MATVKFLKTSWFQHNISPLATSVASIFFQNRKGIALAVRRLAKDYPKDKFPLRLCLNRNNILLPKFQFIDLELVEHFHLSKNITAAKLNEAAKEFRKITGREDFVMIVSEIVIKKISERIKYDPQEIDYDTILNEVVEGALRDPQPQIPNRKQWESKTIRDAFLLAKRSSGVAPTELVYRIQKIGDFKKADVQAIVAAQFMDMPLEGLTRLLRNSESSSLCRLHGSVLKIVERYQWLVRNFKFDISQLPKDPKYIDRKMTELIRESRMPRVLLLFLLHKLVEARKAKTSNDRFRLFSMSREILLFYAPLAERLGLIFLADDFRDQFLRLGSPLTYQFIERKVYDRIGMNYKNAKIFLNICVRDLLALLQEALGVESQDIDIKLRVKSPYSIWNKVEIRQEYAYEGVNDILGIKIICRNQEQLIKIRDILKKNKIFVVNPETIKEVLDEPIVLRLEETGPRQRLAGDGMEIKWRGIKMIGRDMQRTPLEFQIMTREMNIENNHGKAATWLYNLQKEPGGNKQIFDDLEHPDVMTSNYIENFYQLLNYRT